ncbi:hypothetical protein [Streptomyces laurentii]|uniref:hypothetical protein n=1 Tax=Streptomyces laurentii TaxID=39478 RepID=UPI003673E3E5
MTDSGSTDSPGREPGTSDEPSHGIPFGGTATTSDVVSEVKKASSQIYDFAGVPGEASQPGPGVKECEGKDPDTHFQVYHPWNFKPKSKADNDVAMANLKEKLSTDGWTIKSSYRDNSANKNLNLIADNDARKMSVWVVAYSKRATPSIGIQVTSACYQVPEGQTADHF